MNIAEEIKEKGIAKVENFLSADELNQLMSIVKYYSVPKGHNDSFFITNIKTFLIKLLKLDLKKITQSYQLHQFKKKKKINQIARKFFENKCDLKYIDGYYSKAGKEDILPWHTDQAYDGSAEVINNKFNIPKKFFLKFFIYLTDVTRNNGCMSYIPESHKIGFEIRKAIYEKKINYQSYWSLKDFRKIVADNIEYFNTKIDNKLIQNFFEKTDFIKNGNNNHDFDYDAKAGTMIVFDEGGIHRGTKPSLNDRMVIRFLFMSA